MICGLTIRYKMLYYAVTLMHSVVDDVGDLDSDGWLPLWFRTEQICFSGVCHGEPLAFRVSGC